MKKYLLVLFLSALIIPQITFAAWWNPFTWKIFNKANTKTQILEKRVAELEQKLSSIATSTATTTKIQTSVKKQNNQIQEKSKPTSSSDDNVIKTPESLPIKTPTKTNTQTQTNNQIVPITPSPDYKLQTIQILNVAKDSYVRLQNFSQQSMKVISDRKSMINRFLDRNNQLLPQLSGAPDLYKIFSLLNELYINDISFMNEKQNALENTINSSQNMINILDTIILTTQAQDKPVGKDLMMNYYATFSTDKFQNDLISLREGNDKINTAFAKNNAFYRTVFDKVQNYINTASTPASSDFQLNSPSQYIPPTYSVPQLPQITRCTINYLGLQAYVNCATSSF